MDYNDLLLLWKNERLNSSLCSIPKDLYISLDGLLTKLSSDIQKLTYKTAAIIVLDRITFMRKDIVHLRLVKILHLVINNVFFDESVLTWGERRIVKNLRLSIETIGVEKPNILDSRDDSPEMLEYSTIRMLYDVETFIGLDDLSYGPLEKSDIVNLPLENATALIARGVACLIETPEEKNFGESR